MKLSKEEKCQSVQRYLNGGPATDICMEAGIYKSTFYDWIRPYKLADSDAESAVSASESAKMEQYITTNERGSAESKLYHICSIERETERADSTSWAIHGMCALRYDECGQGHFLQSSLPEQKRQ